MTTTFDVTIGWTMSDRANGYSSYDGYRPGVQQHTETITVEWTNNPVDCPVVDDAMMSAIADGSGRSIQSLRDEEFGSRARRLVEGLAEACYQATNAPVVTGLGLAEQIARAIRDTGYYGRQAEHYSLSVGDTVTVGEITLACARNGWERVYLQAVTV